MLTHKISLSRQERDSPLEVHLGVGILSADVNWGDKASMSVLKMAGIRLQSGDVGASKACSVQHGVVRLRERCIGSPVPPGIGS